MNTSNHSSLYVPSTRFGRTCLDLPRLSLGGMRFQQSWKDLDENEITSSSQNNLDEIIQKAAKLGFHHIETARHYGTSELQLKSALKKIKDPKRILQTKIPPRENSHEFEAELERSFDRLDCRKIDLLAIHGLNLFEHLHNTLRPGGCLEVVRRWQKKGKVGHVGFSTHGSKRLILKSINTNEFDYINLHWYFIRQGNEPALDAAKKYDLGVFIISPTDKGGHLHSPSKKLVKLCSPLHPIIFNDLFCLRDNRVHTISVGASRPEDLDLHLEALTLLEKADELIPVIQQRLLQAAISKLGEDWWSTWYLGLPKWNETPGEMNIPVLLWLHNLLEAWDMEDFSRARYGLLGNGSHWFPGSNADCLDNNISEDVLKGVLIKSPWCNEIPSVLRGLRDRIGGGIQERLSSS